MQDATSGAWHSHQLYVTTPSAVYSVMVAGHADSTTPHLEVSAFMLFTVQHLRNALKESLDAPKPQGQEIVE